MRRLLAITALCAIATPAWAESMDATLLDWSGFYVGGQLGYTAGGDADYRFAGLPVSPFNYTHDLRGVLGGVYAGYNYQLHNGLVIGGELDIAWGDRTGASQAPGDPTYEAHSRISQTVSARARLGYGIDRFLPYVSAGAAFGRLDFQESFNGALLDTGSAGLTGWTFGAGLDYAVTDTISLRGEYRYTDFNTAGFETVNLAVPFDASIATHDIRFGLSYAF